MANFNFKGPKRQSERLSNRAWQLLNQNARWARRQNRRNWRRNRPIIRNMKELMNDQIANAEETGQRYRDVYVPYEDKYMGQIEGYQGKVDDFASEVARLKQEARDYGGEANKDFMVGRAQSSVGQNFEKMRENALMTLESRGINPAATRYAGLDYGVRTAEAAAKAAAGTEMGLSVDETSRKMFQDALNREVQALGLNANVMGMRKGMVDIGRTYPALELEQQSGALQSGKGAMGGQLATSDQGLKLRSSPNDFMRTMNESIATWADTLNKEATAELEQQKIDAASSSGIGGIVGAVAPFVQKFIPGFAEGGEVTPDMSPSAGAIPDDVTAKVDTGEFIFPEQAVRFYGTDKLQKMVDRVAPASVEAAIPEEVMGFQGPPQLQPPQSQRMPII